MTTINQNGSLILTKQLLEVVERLLIEIIVSFCRFATWVEGDSLHVTKDEVSAFEQSLDFDRDAGGDTFTDDEDEIDFRLSTS